LIDWIELQVTGVRKSPSSRLSLSRGDTP
jgi:hypothetical protein